MGAMASQITSLAIVTQPFIQVQIKVSVSLDMYYDNVLSHTNWWTL